MYFISKQSCIPILHQVTILNELLSKQQKYIPTKHAIILLQSNQLVLMVFTVTELICLLLQ